MGCVRLPLVSCLIFLSPAEPSAGPFYAGQSGGSRGALPELATSDAPWHQARLGRCHRHAEREIPRFSDAALIYPMPFFDAALAARQAPLLFVPDCRASRIPARVGTHPSNTEACPRRALDGVDAAEAAGHLARGNHAACPAVVGRGKDAAVGSGGCTVHRANHRLPRRVSQGGLRADQAQLGSVSAFQLHFRISGLLLHISPATPPLCDGLERQPERAILCGACGQCEGTAVCRGSTSSPTATPRLGGCAGWAGKGGVPGGRSCSARGPGGLWAVFCAAGAA